MPGSNGGNEDDPVLFALHVLYALHRDVVQPLLTQLCSDTHHLQIKAVKPKLLTNLNHPLYFALGSESDPSIFF